MTKQEKGALSALKEKASPSFTKYVDENYESYEGASYHNRTTDKIMTPHEIFIEWNAIENTKAKPINHIDNFEKLNRIEDFCKKEIERVKDSDEGIDFWCGETCKEILVMMHEKY